MPYVDGVIVKIWRHDDVRKSFLRFLKGHDPIQNLVKNKKQWRGEIVLKIKQKTSRQLLEKINYWYQKLANIWTFPSIYELQNRICRFCKTKRVQNEESFTSFTPTINE